MHKKVSEATPLKKLQAYNTLEIGAGTLNQLPYEVNNESYDCIEPMNFLY